METNYYVYKHTNKVNGKVYIGITCQKPEQRWKNGKGYRENNHFWRSIKKYGWNKGFDHEILYSGLSQKQAEVMEVSLIAYYDSTNQNKGYNISPGGNLSSEETRQKISESLKGEKNPMYGRIGEKHPMYGKHHSEETRQKLSEANKGKHMGRDNHRSKTVMCITTGQCFGSTREAARHYNFYSNAHISSCCNGKRKTAGTLSDGTKLAWRYISDLPRPQLTDSDKVHLRYLLDKYSA